MKPLPVVVGAVSRAEEYAQERGWSGEDCVVVSDADVLRTLDPLLIKALWLVEPTPEIRDVVEELRALWSVRVEYVYPPSLF